MQKRAPHRLLVNFTFAAATTIGVSGCASFGTNINPNNCVEQDHASIGIPLLLETGGKGRAVHNKACDAGYKIGVIPLMGQRPDGNLAPASIIVYYKEYFEKLMGRINTSTPDDAKHDLEIKKFADYFLSTQSNGRLTPAILESMYHANSTNPDAFNPDGTAKPSEEKKQAAKFVCSGDKVFRTCTPQ